MSRPPGGQTGQDGRLKAAPRRVDSRVEGLIARLPGFDAARAQDGLAFIPGFLEDTSRREIVGERERKETEHIQLVEGVGGHEDDRFRRDPATPERLSQPVADLSRKPFDVAARHESHSADRLAVYVDREVRLHRLAGGHLQEVDRVLSGIGMRETVAQLAGDVPVVGVPDYRVSVAAAPGPDRA